MNGAKKRDASRHPLNGGRGAFVWTLCLLVTASATAATATASTKPRPVAPGHQKEAGEKAVAAASHVKLSPLVKRLIDDPITSDAERTELRIFHGQWSQLPDPAQLTPDQAAKLALLKYNLDAPAVHNPAVSDVLRARADLERGQPKAALRDAGLDPSAQAALVRATAYQRLGRLRKATAELRPWRERLLHKKFDDAAELTAAVRGLVMLARIEGRPAADYQLALDLLGTARQLDPLYWPTRLTEAKLLIDKDNRQAGAKALLEALSLNPRAGRAWYRLGRLAVDGYDFDKAALAVKKLRQINPTHPLAARLEARSLLHQRDVKHARPLIAHQLADHPTDRRWLALEAATDALAYDEKATKRDLDHFDTLSPGNPLAWYTVGKVLSSARQYQPAAAALREAIRREPNWPAPHVALGLLLMQSGDLPAARQALSRATQLDPFNRRAHNQLQLVESLLGYHKIETKHFIVKYKNEKDAVLARDMPVGLEKIYHDVTTRFQHAPARKTRIDVMPDERYFAVRITGMPDIWTIAASTGDVIALTPPRQGPHQRGPFNWTNVIRHEFVHTVTLDQTANRVPHWFTEACAVWMETTGRGYSTCQLLAWAVHNDKLFALDRINWGFVRPKTPRDRPLAYAQSEWMLEYLAKTRGRQSIIDLLDLYRRGVSDADAMRRVTGQPAKRFMKGFRKWAATQVNKWGLGRTEADMSDRLKEVIETDGKGVSDDALASLRRANPGQPDLLKLLAKRAIRQDKPAAAMQAVARYAAARPVDPWSQRAKVALAAKAGDLARAMPALRKLDRISNKNPRFALALAKLHRKAGDLDAAAAAIGRALHVEPYNAGYRQLAAAIDLQRGDVQGALKQLRDMAILEPDRAANQVRLAALYARLHRPADAKAAAKKARQLDPDAPVAAYLKP